MSHYSDGVEMGDPIGNPQYVRPVYSGSIAQVGTANRVYIAPIWIFKAMTLNEAYAYCSTLSAGQNMCIGLYADNGGTPQGGALLYDSGDLSTAAVGPVGGLMANPVSLPRGLVWGALATSDAVMAFFKADATMWLPAGAIHSMFSGCFYNLGGWGVLTNPCPAVAQLNAKPILHFHVASINE